jgi:hypothetical protein
MISSISPVDSLYRFSFEVGYGGGRSKEDLVSFYREGSLKPADSATDSVGRIPAATLALASATFSIACLISASSLP